MIPSNEQQAIYDEWENSDNNLLVNAVAGSGKTTLLLNLLERCDERTLFLAFNKSIQEEIQGVIDTRGLMQGKAMTLHALGLLAIRKSTGAPKINKGKNFQIIKKIQEKFPNIFKRMAWKDKLRASFTLMDFNDVSRMFLTDDLEEIIPLMGTMDKGYFPFPGLERSVWPEFIKLRDQSYEGRNLEIDFLDMIYLPVKKGYNIPLDPIYLMIDEVQDLNYAQHKMVDMLLEQSRIKKWVAVGDHNQSIYGFSGSFTNSMDRLAEKENVKQMPLTTCYRCPVTVIEEANEVYDIMQPFKEDDGIVDWIDDPNEIKAGSMVICRNSGPLVSLYFQLLGMERPCYIKGDDILNSIKRFLKPYLKESVISTKMKMHRELHELSLKTDEQGRMEYHMFRENYANFILLAQHMAYENSKVDALLEKLDNMFVQKEGGIMLCTIHKSKGLENDVVYILNENLIPSKFARSAQQLQQETNLKYVARTRAKRELYYLQLD